MSLFGSSPDDSTPQERAPSRSLFDDDAKPSPGASSLFENTNNEEASPWSMPTPKKGGRAELIKKLLAAGDVPEQYVEAFDSLIESDDSNGGQTSQQGLQKLLRDSNLSSAMQSRLLNLVAPGGLSNGLERNAFNVLLALVGLAQEGEDATLDSVDEHRKSTTSQFLMLRM